MRHEWINVNKMKERDDLLNFLSRPLGCFRKVLRKSSSTSEALSHCASEYSTKGNERLRMGFIAALVQRGVRGHKLC